MYDDLSDTQLLEIIVSELVECDAMAMLDKLTRPVSVELEADERANITISTAIIQAAITSYKQRYPTKAVQS